MTQDPNVDPLDAAMDAEVPIRVVFGEVQVDTYYCALVKGQDKPPFDPGIHPADARRVAIHLTIIPTRGDFNVDRKLIAESHEWARVIKPSLRALGTDLKTVNNKFVQVQMVPVGKYIDKASGEERQRTMPKFIAIYPGMEECIDAAEAYFGGGAASAPATPPPVTAPAGNGINPKERETAIRFLPALWGQAKGDVTKFGELIAGNPLTSKYFDLGSAEVVALVASSDVQID